VVVIIPYLFALLSAAAYGLNDSCIQMGLRTGRATTGQALIINLISGNILIAIITGIYFFTTGFPPLNWGGVLFFIAAGITAPFLGRIFSFSSINRIGATRTTTLRVSETFFTMLIAMVLLKDIIPFMSFVGAIVLVAGIIMLISQTSRKTQMANEEVATSAEQNINLDEGTQKNERSFVDLVQIFYKLINIGILFALISGFFFGLGGVFRQLALSFVPSAILGSFIGTFIALISNGLFTYFSDQLNTDWHITRREIFFFSLGGLGNTTGMLMFFLALIVGGSVSMTTALKNTSPLFTLFLSWIFLRKFEQITLKLVLSIVLVILGSALIVIF
jgi:uncharacterized membrane protein